MDTLTQRNTLKVVDPGLRIPAECDFPSRAYGYLYLPAGNLGPIHPASLKRLVEEGMRTGRPTFFVPEVPVSNKLGMMPYPALAYWVPEIDSISWTQRLKEFRKGEYYTERRIQSSLETRPAVKFSVTPLEEQVFYYVDHFNSISTKPSQVSVIVTNACNLKCVMCPYHSPLIKPSHGTDFFKDVETMDWSLMLKIAEECGRIQAPIKIGNIEEPLLHPKIVEFIQLCRSQGVPTAHITSNGLLLSDEKARALLDAGLTSLYISIDAARPDTYKRVRGANLEKVEGNLHNFLKVRKEMDKNCLVMVSFIRNEGVTQEEEAEFIEKWSPIVDGVIVYNLAEYVKGNARVANINEVTQTFMDEANGRWACLNPWQEIYLLPDGRVYYCCETVSKLAHENLVSMGDYHTQSIQEVWHGPVFKELRKSLLKNELEEWSACKDCGIWMAHVCGTEERDDMKIVSNMMTEIFYPKR